MPSPAIAIDLGGSHATIALVRGAELLAFDQVALDSSQPLLPALDGFARVIRELLAKLELHASECQGIALGFCGLADARTGRVVSTNKKYEDAPSIDFGDWSRRN